MGRLKVSNLTYNYDGFNNDVLKNVSFELNSGEHLSVIGHSGCGKSTLIKLVQGSLKPRNKKDIENTFKHISYVPQTGNLLPYLNIKENLELHYKLINHKKLVNNELLKKILEIVNLEESVLLKYPRELSGGQKQRASIANALIIENTDLLIFDESFSALDEITRFDIQDTLMLILHYNKNLAILEITHNIDEALISSDRILHLDNGVIKFIGTPNELYFSRDKLSTETTELVWKTNLICKINWDAWRISALKKMEKLNKDIITIVNDEDKPIGIVSKQAVLDSLNNNINNTLLTELI